VPTAVLDLDFQQLPPTITVPQRYDRALILIRLRGRPVGQAVLPVVGGRVGGDNLRAKPITAAHQGPEARQYTSGEILLRETSGIRSTGGN